jgi:hypothetical protein
MTARRTMRCSELLRASRWLLFYARPVFFGSPAFFPGRLPCRSPDSQRAALRSR